MFDPLSGAYKIPSMAPVAAPTMNANNVPLPFLLIVFLSLTGIACSQKNKLSDSALLDMVQKQTIKYFTDGAEPVSGMARERFHTDDNYPEKDKNIITSGGSGFGVMCLIVAIERKFITREEGLQRLEKIVHFLETADRFHGAWPHWWN